MFIFFFLKVTVMLYSRVVPIRNVLLVQEKLIAIFGSKIKAKEPSSETELESHCN